MIRVLALDTSTWLGSLALLERDAPGRPRLVAESEQEVQYSHADHLLPRIALLLAEAGWAKSSVDVYAATRGPGSFTGIRVGLGTVRGLALATGRPAVAETTLRSLVEAHGPADRERLALMEAGRSELYGSLHDAASTPPVVLDEPWLDARARIAGMRTGSPTIVVPGPGTRITPEELPASALLARTPRSIAAALGRLVLSRELAELDAASLAPLYIRPPDAILKRKSS